MVLKSLSILNYRNIEQAELDFSQKLNCFVGNNGMGKTNLLDAVYYLSFCKSHANQIDSQNIRHDTDFALIQGKYINSGKEDDYLCSLKRKHKKIFRKNKKEYDKLSEHIGCLPLVLVSPSDSDIILGLSEERRRLMDVVISQFNKEYLQRLIKYNNALSQRNALLRSECADGTLFQLWEEQLVQEGLYIFEKRTLFVKSLEPIFQQYYDFICQSNEKVKLEYSSQLSEKNFASLLEQKREKDIILGYTTVGVHRDDLNMYLDDYPIKKVGSQGQNKTFIIALKLAQFNYLLTSGSVTPILLLDDVFDKLDFNRVEQIIKLVSGKDFGQIFITDTNREHLVEMLSQISDDHKIFEVNKGGVKEISAL